MLKTQRIKALKDITPLEKIFANEFINEQGSCVTLRGWAYLSQHTSRKKKKIK